MFPIQYIQVGESKNYNIYKEIGGFNKLYLSKDLPPEITIQVPKA